MDIKDFVQLSYKPKSKKISLYSIQQLVGEEVRVRYGNKRAPHIVSGIEIKDDRVTFIVREKKGSKLGPRKRRKPNQIMEM